MKLPKTVFVKHVQASRAITTYLLAGETLKAIDVQDGDEVGTYQLVETGKVQVTVTLAKPARK